MELMNQVRGYRFMEGVFRSQMGDPYCPRCSAYANTLAAVRERLARFEAEQTEALQSLPAEVPAMLYDARSGLLGLPSPAEPTGQKKAGNCKLPQGVCFIKASYALLQQV